MKISVVIPTYQRRELVLMAISSALGQNRAANEILVVDDGSTDGTTRAIRETYGDRVQVLSQANRGPSAARNLAVKAADGDVVAFLDSDDRWLPNHLAAVEALATAYPAAVLVSTQLAYRFGNDTPEAAVFADLTEGLLLTTVTIGMLPGIAVHRKAFLAVDGFDEGLRYGEDIDLFLRLSLFGPMALMAAKTFEPGRGPASLYASGRLSGAYLEMLELTAAKMHALLQKTDRPDASSLRNAAEARFALGKAIRSLAGNASAIELRPHLSEICRLSPALRKNPATLPATLPVVLPDWEDIGRRLRLLTTLVQAWPDHSGIGFSRLCFAGAWAALFPARPVPAISGRQARRSG